MRMLNKQERKVIKIQLHKEETAIERIERQYRIALRDIEDKIKQLLSDELTQSRIYQLQYQHALRGQVAGILDKLHGDQYATIQQYLHDSYQDGFIGTMYSIHGQGIPLIVPMDQDAAVKAILTDSKISEGLYKSIDVDVKLLKKTISNEISRGIASNLPFADIARNIKNRTRAPMSRAKTIVRTEAHRISQAGADDARNAAKDRGCDVVKQWDSTLDSGTRPTHKRLDGQIRETNEPFVISDTKKAMYPGDFGYAEEDCNCRCVALTRAKWALDEDELKQLKERAEYFKLNKEDDFNAFEEKYLKAAESENAPKENEKIAKNREYAVDTKVIDSRGYADKFSKITNDTQERREFLKAAKEVLHHRSGQNGEDLYLYNRAKKRWIKSVTGVETGTPAYTADVIDAIKAAKKGELVSFHNHPASMPPSASDLNAALHNGYSVGYALCHDGKIFEYTAPKQYIEMGIYNRRIAYFKQMGYNEYDAQMKTMQFLSGEYGFEFKEVK